MALRRFLSIERPRAPPSSPSSVATTPASIPAAPSAPPRPLAPHPSAPPQRAYPDYVDNSAGRLGLNTAVAVASLLGDMPALPLGFAGPLTQVMDVVSGIINVVEHMRENTDDCAYLITRVVRFLQSLVDELKASAVPIADGTPTAARLFALRSNLMAISDDTIRWSRLSVWESYMKCDRIKVAISRHAQNLTNCLITFPIRATIGVANTVDGANASVLPGLPTLTALQGDREGPQVAFEDTAVSDPCSRVRSWITTIAFSSLQSLLRAFTTSSSIQWVRRCSSRLERLYKDGWRRWGYRQSQSLPAQGTVVLQTVTRLHTAHERHVSYLTSQISELTMEAGTILPHIAVNTGIETQSVEWETHRPQTGDPKRQLRETVSATLQLLNKLENISQIQLDAAMLAVKMSALSLNLSDLGLGEEAFGVQTIVVELRRTGRDISGLAKSLINLSADLSKLGRREEALQRSEEAASIYRMLAADRPDTFRPDLAMPLNNLSSHLSGLGRHEEALQIIEETISQCHSNRLSGLGRREEALQIIEEAVSISRMLAADQPDAFRPDLAMSLNNLSSCLSHLGRHEEALQIIEETVSIYRTLASERPTVFHPDLARSPVILFGIRSDLGRMPEALLAIQEVVNLHRRLATEYPAVFSRQLATSLSMLSRSYSGMGRHEDALLAQKEVEDLDQ